MSFINCFKIFFDFKKYLKSFTLRNLIWIPLQPSYILSHIRSVFIKLLTVVILLLKYWKLIGKIYFIIFICNKG